MVMTSKKSCKGTLILFVVCFSLISFAQEALGKYSLDYLARKYSSYGDTPWHALVQNSLVVDSNDAYCIYSTIQGNWIPSDTRTENLTLNVDGEKNQGGTEPTSAFQVMYRVWDYTKVVVQTKTWGDHGQVKLDRVDTFQRESETSILINGVPRSIDIGSGHLIELKTWFPGDQGGGYSYLTLFNVSSTYFDVQQIVWEFDEEYDSAYVKIDSYIGLVQVPVLSVSPTSHDFGTSETSYQFTVKNTGGGTLNWNASESLDWLSLNKTSGSLGAGSSENVTATVSRSGKSPGTYNGTISFTSNGGNQNVSVSMTVSGADPVLSVSPTSLDFGTTGVSLPITVKNTGGGTLSWNASESLDWLSLNKTSGSLGAGSSENVTATVSRTGKSPGTYNGTISFTSNGGNQNVSVSMTVPGADPVLSVSPTSYDFGTSETSYQFTVKNTGGGTLNWNASESLDWLSLNKTSGSLGAGISENVTATVSRTGKSPGTYNGTISFTSNGGSQNVSVSMTVPQPTPDPVLSVSPTSLDFGTTGVSLTITVRNSGGGTLNWNASESLDWLSLNKTSGSLGAGISENVTATVSRTGKSPGTYNGTISFTSNGGSQNVSVSMTVPQPTPDPVLSVSPTSLDFGTTGVSLTITVRNSGGGTLNWNASESLDWLSLSKTSGSLGAGISENVTVTVSRTGKSPGTYNGTISFTSNGGSQNVSVSMTVADTTPPQISNLIVNPTIAKTGTNLTITFTVSETLQSNPTVIVAGNGATFNSKSGNNYAYSYIVKGTEGEGSKAVNVSATDLAGNTGSGSTTVTFDFTAPTVTNLAVNPAIAKEGTNLTITFTVNETLQGDPLVMVAGNAASFNSKSGNNYTYTYRVQGTEGEGSKAVTVSATDSAGNTGSGSTTVTFDFTAPAVSNLVVNPTIAKSGTNLTITFTVSETLQGNPVVTVAGNAATFNSKSGNNYVYAYTVQGTEGEGNKPVNVSATDLVGNTGSASKTVTFDFTAPTVFNLTVAPATAKSGTNLTITFTVSETLPGNPLVMVAGNAATFNSKSGNNYVYTYTVQGTEGEGNKPVNVSATDSVGNTGSGSTTVTFDFTAPTISNLRVNPTIAKAGVDLTITFTVSETLPGNPLVMVAGNAAVINTKVGNDYAYTYTVQGIEEDGNKTVNVSAMDLAGNPGSANTTVLFDFRVPKCEADKSEIWHAEDIIITLTATDEGEEASGIAIARYNWDTQASETVGTAYNNGDTIVLSTETGENGKELHLYARDNAGNTQIWSGTYKLDKTGPICSADKSGVWHIEDVTITLTFKASTGDINIANYNWDTPASSTTGRSYYNGQTISLNKEANGKLLYLYVKDNVGREKTWSGRYYLDKTDPICSADKSGTWHREDINIVLVATDVVSGIAVARYRWDTPASETGGVVYGNGSTITLTTEANGRTLYLYVKDIAGREKTWNGTYYLDKTPPSNCLVSINGGDDYTSTTSITLTLSASDNGSGVSKMKFRNEGESWTSEEDYGTSKSWTIPEGDGEKSVYVQYRDTAGNWSAATSDTIILDTISPIVKLLVEKARILPDGEIVGVIPDTGMEARFSKAMKSTTVEEGFELKAVRDNLNRAINEKVSLNFEWDVSTKTARMNLKTGELKKNYLYRLRVTDKVRDLAGNTVKGERELIFRTIMDHTKKNIVVKATNERLMVTLEANALKEDGYLIINAERSQFGVDPEGINVANEKSTTNRWYPIEGCLWEIKACNKNGNWIKDNFGSEVKITFPYDEEEVVENTPIPLSEETLMAFWLNEEYSNWVKVPGSRVDRENNVVITGEVPKFSVFSLLGTALYDLRDAYAYPVPWKPNDGKDETGTEEGGITFTRLYTEAVIRIYTISGELVKEYEYKPGYMGEWKWDVKTSNGEKVFSGVYIYYIESEKECKTGKLVIIR